LFASGKRRARRPLELAGYAPEQYCDRVVVRACRDDIEVAIAVQVGQRNRMCVRSRAVVRCNSAGVAAMKSSSSVAAQNLDLVAVVVSNNCVHMFVFVDVAQGDFEGVAGESYVVSRSGSHKTAAPVAKEHS
jgi:hypothetical protein